MAFTVADLFAAAGTLAVGVELGGHISLALHPAALLLVAATTVGWHALGLYDRDPHTLCKTTLDEVPAIVQASVLYALGVWIAEGAVVHGSLSKGQVIALAAGCFVLLTLVRSLLRSCLRSVMPPERCLVVGAAAETSRAVSALAAATGAKAEVVGRVALQPGDECSVGVPTLGYTGMLAEVVAEHEIDRVIVAAGAHPSEDVLTAIRLAAELSPKLSVAPRVLEVVGLRSPVENLDGLALLGVRPYGPSRFGGVVKRVLDIVAAGAMLVALSPVFVAIAIAIKLDSPGPVFFSQPRIGRWGRQIRIVKFRSMVDGADAAKDELRPFNEAQGGLFKISHDPRVTRVGRFLRAMSFDELPQLLDVLRGEMSIVGPRPLVPDEDAQIVGWQRRRLALRPGMTGLWQIFGSARVPLPEMVNIDYFYGASWSMWLDFRILLRTVTYVLRRRGQ